MSNHQISQLPPLNQCKGGYNNINSHTCHITCNSLIDFISKNNYKLTQSDFDKFIIIFTNNICYKHCSSFADLYYSLDR